MDVCDARGTSSSLIASLLIVGTKWGRGDAGGSRRGGVADGGKRKKVGRGGRVGIDLVFCSGSNRFLPPATSHTGSCPKSRHVAHLVSRLLRRFPATASTLTSPTHTGPYTSPLTAPPSSYHLLFSFRQWLGQTSTATLGRNVTLGADIPSSPGGRCSPTCSPASASRLLPSPATSSQTTSTVVFFHKSRQRLLNTARSIITSHHLSTAVARLSPAS